MNKIWIVIWETDRGDRGIEGYWREKPTKESLEAYMAKWCTDDYEAGTLHYELQYRKEVGTDG